MSIFLFINYKYVKYLNRHLNWWFRIPAIFPDLSDFEVEIASLGTVGQKAVSGIPTGSRRILNTCLYIYFFKSL